MSRSFRFLSELHVEPTTVTLEHFEKFRHSLQNDALIRNPNKTWRLAVGVWNSSKRRIPGWPNLEICLSPRRDTYTLPWTTFPSSLKADAEAFLARMSGTDLLEETSCRPVRASTLDTRRRQLLTSASVLVHRGRDPSSIGSLADVVEFENFKEVLRFFTARRGNTSSTMIEHLARFLKSVARHWVEVDAAVLQKMSAVVKNLTVAHPGMTPKNRQRLSVFKDEENIYALLDLPQRLMRDARSGRYSMVRSAVLAQVAVAIELLLVRPLRIGNLSGLELYRHLIQTRTGSWYVAICEDEVKNEVHLEHEVPAESAKLLEQYLNEFRPLLAKPGSAALFPGENGLGAKSKSTLAGQIKEKIHQYTGLRVNSHLFRHFAGFAHLRSHPGEYAVVAHVLGHKSLNTTKKYYTGMEAAAAFRHFDRTMMDLRNRARPSKGTLIQRSRPNHRNKPRDGKD
jgi:integrase